LTTRTRPLTTDEVLGLETTPDRAGAAGFRRDQLGVTFADFQEHTDANTWRCFGRYLRDIPDQEAQGAGWLIHGPTGTGKTSVLALLAEAIVRTHSDLYEPRTEAQFRSSKTGRPYVVLVSSVTIADHLARRDKGDERWQERVDLWRSCRHLMIDDLGAEFFEPWAVNAWYELIDSRTGNNLPTHCTSNLAPESAVSGANAERILSRLRRRSYELVLVGADRRTPISPRRLLEVEF
jgi:DNA replication protein DnaC